MPVKGGYFSISLDDVDAMERTDPFGNFDCKHRKYTKDCAACTLGIEPPRRIPGTVGDLQPIPGVNFLGFGYKARHGKNAACDWIHLGHPGRTRIYAFADALKVFCRCNGMREKDGNFLQTVGTIVRDVDVEHWIKALYWRIHEERPRYALICDVRYNNEAAFIKQMGGSLVNVRRYNDDGSLFIDPSRSATHQSECELDGYTNWDWEIRNDRGLSDLNGQAEYIFQQFTEDHAQ
jgi:hypothetical protein